MDSETFRQNEKEKKKYSSSKIFFSRTLFQISSGKLH